MAIEVYNMKFATIQLLSKTVAEFPRQMVENETFNFRFTIDIKLFIPLKSVGVYTTILAYEAIGGIEVSNIKTLCVFEVEDYEDVFKIVGDGLYEVPVNLEITLKSASFSTTRGIAYSEYQGTYLQGLIIPLFDVASAVLKGRKEISESTGI